MQVKQISAEGLKHSLEVTIPAAIFRQRKQEKLQKLAKTVKLPGFRPGKVPLPMVEKKYGQQVQGEVLEATVKEGSTKALQEKALRPAMQPKIQITSFEDGKDLSFKMEVEVLPEVPVIDFASIEITKPVVEIGGQEVDEALARMTAASQEHTKEVKRVSAAGDAVEIDFEGFVKGEAFAGGKGEGHKLVLGSNSFIPGFEDQLVGKKSGDKVDVKVTFPKQYHSEALAGKDAVFQVTVHRVLEGEAAKVDDAFAQRLGLKDLATLKDAVKAQLKKEASEVSRLRAKKALFDTLEERCVFPVPEQMTQSEFKSIWHQVEHAMKDNPDAEGFAGKSKKELEQEYREMAVRRVKLGILLSDIGRKEHIRVSQQELQQAVLAEARRYPGQEQKVVDYFLKNPAQVQALEGPLLEEKVVDLLLNQKVKLTTKTVTAEELREEDAPSPKKKPAGKASSGQKNSQKAAAEKSGKKAPKKA